MCDLFSKSVLKEVRLNVVVRVSFVDCLSQLARVLISYPYIKEKETKYTVILPIR